jgi:hypothetical protein
MKLSRSTYWMALQLVLTLAFLPACSDDDPVSPEAEPLVGTWQVTSFQALSQDFIASGMTMSIVLADDGDYTLTVTNDLIGTCEGALTNCTQSGNYTATSTQLTIDPGTGDAVTFTYSLSGSTMTWTATIDGNPATLTLTKTS